MAKKFLLPWNWFRGAFVIDAMIDKLEEAFGKGTLKPAARPPAIRTHVPELITTDALFAVPFPAFARRRSRRMS